MRKSCGLLLSFWGVLSMVSSGMAQPVETLELPAMADATLYSNYPSPTANSVGRHLFVGYTFRQSIRRALLRFDPTLCLPRDAVIQSATLRLHCSLRSLDSVPLESTVHALITPWEEGSSRAELPEGGGAPATPGDPTWDFARYDSILWGVPGGDFDEETLAEASVTALGFAEWSGEGLAAAVQSWLAEPAHNHGLVLRGSESEEGSAKRFDSRENAIREFRPVMRITYLLPPSASEPHSADTDGNGALSLSELLRVVQLYNAGTFSCGESEDGWALGADGGTSCGFHDLDFETPQWRFTLGEVLRAIQLYNAGAHYRCAADEDGWCPGLNPCE